MFCLVQIVVFRNFAVLKNIHRTATGITPTDIVGMTATALGGLTIGGVAVMQYRKHKWEEVQTEKQDKHMDSQIELIKSQLEDSKHQAKMEEDTRTGERLSKAIEHLGRGKAGAEDDLHIRLGAIFEFSNLAEDSPRNKENIVQILTAFIKSCIKKQSGPQDIQMAARVLSLLTRELIEETAERASKDNKLRPPECVFEATEQLSDFAEQDFHSRGEEKSQNEYICWQGLNADWLILDTITLTGSNLSNAHLKGTSFEGAKLAGVNLNAAYLEGVRFILASLKEVDFGFAHLEGAVFTDVLAITDRTNFGYAFIDNKTYFGTFKMVYGRETLYDATAQVKTWQDEANRMRIRDITFAQKEPERPND